MEIIQLFNLQMEDCRMNISDLSKKTGINRVTLSNVLKGKTQLTYAQAELISKFLELEINVRLSKSDEPYILVKATGEEAQFEVTRVINGKDELLQTINLELFPLAARFDALIEELKPFIFGSKMMLFR